ncbi:MAG TPA: ATP-binding protein, partial [Nakamurella sp.]
LLVAYLLVGDQEWPWSLQAVVIAVAGLVSVVSLVVRWRGASGPGRRQILGFVVASAIPVAALLVTLLPPLWDANLDWLLMFWPIGVAVAVLVAVVGYDLYGIRTTARRVAIYAVMVAVLSGVFAVVLVVLLGALSGRVVAGQFRWVAVVAVTAVILAVDPVRRRLLTRIERRLLGQRSDLLPALSQIGGESSPEAYSTIVGTVASVVRSPAVVLSVQDRDGLRVIASCGEPSPDPVLLPLSYGGELVGELAIAPRTPGERFQAADDKLLALLAVQVAIQLYVARRDAELTQLRQETVQQSAAQREQLGQDLHDGLAPLLAGASLTADALRRGMPPGSRDEADAARLTDRLLQASTEVRRLAHDLQSTVHDRGLERSISDHIAGLHGPGTPSVTAQIRADDLPAAVTEAAYLIVLEAINNAVRHGHPRHVRVSIDQHAAEVSITVEDDGDGISQPYISGLGITSMRRRADALDGGLQLLPRPGGGTILAATLRSHP